MNIRSLLVAGVVLVLASIPCVAEPDEVFGVTLISEGAGTWGVGRFVYEGSVAISNGSFTLSITNVQRHVESGEDGVLKPRPFTAGVTFLEGGKVLSISLEMSGPKPDMRVLGSAYNVTYTLMSNVFYEFREKDWQTLALSTDSSGQVIMNRRRPETLIMGPLGSLPAEQYGDGIVRADRFVVLPILDGDGGGVSIGFVRVENELTTQVHLRQIPKGWQFPAVTQILSVSRKAALRDRPISEILDGVRDRGYASSFNLFEIRLNRVKKDR